MRRGEIWTIAGGPDYMGKPRPAVIVQDNDFDATGSVTICAFTTDPTRAALFRVYIEPSADNGLHMASSLMADKLTTVPRERLGTKLGRLSDQDMVRLNRAMLVFLGLARSTRATDN